MAGKKTRRPSKSSVPRKKSGPSRDRQRLKLLLAGLFVTGFLISCLVVLSQMRQALRTVPPPAPPETAVAVPVPIPDRNSLVSEIQLEVDGALWRAGVSFDRLRIATRQQTVHYEIRAAMPPEKIFEDLSRRVCALAPGIKLELAPKEGEITIRRHRDTLFLVRFKEEGKPALPPGPRPRVAIIVDDLGPELATAKALLDIDLPLTFAIMPDVGKSRQVAELAHSRKREVMLHIPMEPRSYPKDNPGETALFDNLPSTEVRQRMARFLAQVPHAAGGNNHMGSRFTENDTGMDAALAVLREKGLFFIDSRTSSRSVGAAAAQRAGIPFAGRDVFLDNVREVEAIRREIRKLAGLARRKGEAIGICHPYPQTIEALAREAETLRSQGIEVVPASRLVRKPVAASP